MKKIIVALLLVVCCITLFGCTVEEPDRMFSDVEISIIAQTHYELQLSERRQKELFDLFEKLDWKDYTEEEPLPLGEDDIFVVANALVRLKSPEGTVVRERKAISFVINSEARFVALKFLPQEQKIPESANKAGAAPSENSATTRTAKLSEADLEKITSIFLGATRQEFRPFFGVEITHKSDGEQPPQQQKKQVEEILEKLPWQPHDGQSHMSQIENIVNVFANVDVVYWGPQGWTTGLDQWIFRIDLFTGYAIADCVYISSLSSRHFAKISDADLATLKAIFGYVQPVVESHRLTIKDDDNFIFDKPSRQSFNTGEEIVLHSQVWMDVDWGMYANGELVSIQTSIRTEDGYIWEYRFVMPDYDVTLEFKTMPKHPMGDPHRLTIIDPENYIFDKPSGQSFYKGEEIVLHSNVLTDVDLGMYVDGELASIQSIPMAEWYVWEYCFVMPDHDVTLEFKIVPTNPYVDLADVFPEATGFGAANVESVRFEHGYVGVAPGSLIDIEYTTDTQDIAGALQALDSQLVEEDPFYAQVDGGWYDTITFCTAGGTFSLTIANNIVQKDGTYYHFVGSYKQPQYGRKCHSFLTYSDNYTVVKDGVALGEFEGLAQFEFSEYVDQVVLPQTGITLQTEFGTISILSDTRFVFDGKDYVLTKGSFDFLKGI